MLKNNKGITLIALVITIIVLLILAGVSIAMLTGENGILTQAEKADDHTAMAEAADKINMALNGEFANLLADGYLSGMTSATGTMSTSTQIATANGLDEKDFTITPGSSVTDATAVLTITSKKFTKVTGKITYTAGGTGTDSKYSIERAKYPTELTSTDEDEP